VGHCPTRGDSAIDRPIESQRVLVALHAMCVVRFPEDLLEAA
jgi:hypothetical protein